MPLSEDIQQYAPGTQINLFVVDFSTTGLPSPPSTMFMYPGVKANYGDIVFNGDTYSPFPVEVTGLSKSADGPLPQPVMSISNIGGFISQQMQLYNDFIGAKVIRYQTFAKYLDGEPEADPNAKVTEIYFVEQKKAENPKTVQIKLASAVDVMNAKLPSRIMLPNTCLWQYKDDVNCPWPGTDPNYYFDASDEPVVNQEDDVCGKSLTSCRRRFCHWNGTKYLDPKDKVYTSAFPALGRSK